MCKRKLLIRVHLDLGIADLPTVADKPEVNLQAHRFLRQVLAAVFNRDERCCCRHGIILLSLKTKKAGERPAVFRFKASNIIAVAAGVLGSWPPDLPAWVAQSLPLLGSGFENRR